MNSGSFRTKDRAIVAGSCARVERKQEFGGKATFPGLRVCHSGTPPPGGYPVAAGGLPVACWWLVGGLLVATLWGAFWTPECAILAHFPGGGRPSSFMAPQQIGSARAMAAG
jgi:hypothetical protein